MPGVAERGSLIPADVAPFRLYQLYWGAAGVSGGCRVPLQMPAPALVDHWGYACKMVRLPVICAGKVVLWPSGGPLSLIVSRGWQLMPCKVRRIGIGEPAPTPILPEILLVVADVLR